MNPEAKNSSAKLQLQISSIEAELRVYFIVIMMKEQQMNELEELVDFKKIANCSHNILNISLCEYQSNSELIFSQFEPMKGLFPIALLCSVD